MLVIALLIGVVWIFLKIAEARQATDSQGVSTTACDTQLSDELAARVRASDLAPQSLPADVDPGQELGAEPEAEDGLSSAGVCRAKVTIPDAGLTDEAATIWLYAPTGEDATAPETELTLKVTVGGADSTDTTVIAEETLAGS
jgi:hypothetical protein